MYICVFLSWKFKLQVMLRHLLIYAFILFFSLEEKLKNKSNKVILKTFTQNSENILTTKFWWCTRRVDLFSKNLNLILF